MKESTYNKAFWEQEKPRPVPLAEVVALAATHPPHEEPAAFLASLCSSTAQQYQCEAPLDELRRLVSVCEHRGPHVLPRLRDQLVLEAGVLSESELQERTRVLQAELDPKSAVAHDLIARLRAVLPLCRARDAGVLTDGQVKVLCLFAINDGDPTASLNGPGVEAHLADVVAVLPDLADLAPDYAARFGPELERMAARRAP